MGIKINDLTPDVIGKRIKVTKVAPSEAERQGYCNDTERLSEACGVVENLVPIPLHGQPSIGAQLWVEWDDEGFGGPGRLMLAGDDEVEVIGGA